MKQAILFLFFAGAALAQMPTLASGGSGSGGGGNCTVAGSIGDLQMNNGSSNCAASHVNDNGTTVASTLPLKAPLFQGTDTTGSAASCYPGFTSGTVCYGSADVAGTAILYINPSTNGASGQVLEDSGATGCPTVPTGATGLLPTTCHQLVWASAGGGSPVSVTLCPMGSCDVATGGTQYALTANTPIYWQFLVPSPGIIINHISLFDVNATSGHAVVGITDSTCAKVADSGLTVSAEQVYDFPFSALSLSAGVYYLGLSSDAANSFFATAGNNGYAGYIANAGEGATTYRYFVGSNSSVTTAGVTALPATCGTRTAINGGGTSEVTEMTIH